MPNAHIHTTVFVNFLGDPIRASRRLCGVRVRFVASIDLAGALASIAIGLVA
jgi:hypothetical protein